MFSVSYHLLATAKPDLRVKIQSGTHFEYWTAFTESEGAGFTCFAKKLPGLFVIYNIQKEAK